MSKNNFSLFTDGGARGNPGPAAIGGVLLDPTGKKIEEYAVYLGTATNNQAEYQALKHGLVVAKKHHISHLTCYLDSELVVRQMNREYKVKDSSLAKLFVEIYSCTVSFQKLTFVHISREKNYLADALVNKALDEHS